MERAWYRDQVLLGHGSRKLLGYPYPASSPKLPLRNSDVDFSDVFGGPPRSSIAEMRSSIGETVDSLAVRRGEETPPLRNSWSNFSEKPVFGGESPNRRRQPGGDFFDDIFRIDDSPATTPRKQDRDPLSSTPSSRALSPVRPLPPKFEQFGGGSSFPAQLGLSSKLTKGTDYSTFSTPCHGPVGNKEGALSTFALPSSQRLVRVASEKKLGQDYSRYDSRAFYRQSRFSHAFSLSTDGSSKDTESARQETGSQFSKDRSSSEVSGDNSQFHFSIYKWASKGVTLMMPLKGGKRTKSKEHGKNESVVSGLPAPVLQGVNLSSLDENMSNPNTSFHFQYDIQDLSSSQDLNMLMKNDIVEEPILFTPEPKKPLHNSLSDITEEPGRNRKLHPHSSAYSSYTSLSNPADKEECQPKVNIHCPLNDSSDDPGKDMLRPDEEEIGMPSNVLSAGNVDGSIKVKTQTGGKIILNHTRATGPSSQVEMLSSEDKMPENKVKGKVKEFVKIFNQEASPKHTCNIDTKCRSSRRKDLGAFKVEDSSSFSTMKAYGKETVSHEQCSKILTDAPAMADQISRQTRMAYIDVNINNKKIHDFSSEKNSISRSYSETKQEEFKKTFENTQECHSENPHLNCLVEQLPGELQKQQESDHDQDEIQISNAKIQKWSHGKEGNIRSLLSTLHYVLWPDSGWRPLPLVDIIEGTSVKRAYQKALLCLHPDKLQQKGAPTHQKYIAEKVFDVLQGEDQAQIPSDLHRPLHVLQEAWDHFNSLSAI